MNDMSRKKLYIWRLAQFLSINEKKMSVSELADHLNRNGFRTSYGEQYAGERGTLRLISMTYRWIDAELGLGGDEATPIAVAFVKRDGSYAYSTYDPLTEDEA